MGLLRQRVGRRRRCETRWLLYLRAKRVGWECCCPCLVLLRGQARPWDGHRFEMLVGGAVELVLGLLERWRKLPSVSGRDALAVVVAEV